MATSQDSQTYIQGTLQDGLAELPGEHRAERMRYVAFDRSGRWFDPQEKNRAELLAELIYKYDYTPELIRLVVNSSCRKSAVVGACRRKVAH